MYDIILDVLQLKTDEMHSKGLRTWALGGILSLRQV